MVRTSNRSYFNQAKAGPAKSVEGNNIGITTGNGGVMVDKARVTRTDIAASNGAIHVIDRVMIPNRRGLGKKAGPVKSGFFLTPHLHDPRPSQIIQWKTGP